MRLTARGREVLSYLALGWETRYIAEELGVSWYTARNHIENLRVKLGAYNRLEGVMVAMRLGMLPEDDTLAWLACDGAGLVLHGRLGTRKPVNGRWLPPQYENCETDEALAWCLGTTN